MRAAKLNENSKTTLKVVHRHYTEPQLVNYLYEKNQTAFSYLYDMYASNINCVILRMVGNKELSKDILQDVFLKIWNNIDKYDASKARLYTWMLTITRNITIDVLKSKNYQMQSKTVSQESSFSLTNRDCEFKQFDNLKMKQELLHLNQTHFKIINLAYFGGFSLLQISRILDMPIGTVKTRMRSAILHLRKIMPHGNKN